MPCCKPIATGPRASPPSWRTLSRVASTSFRISRPYLCEYGAGLGQLRSASTAHDELHIQLVLHSCERLLQRRLRDTNSRCRTGCGAGVRQSNKVFKLPQIQRYHLRPFKGSAYTPFPCEPVLYQSDIASFPASRLVIAQTHDFREPLPRYRTSGRSSDVLLTVGYTGPREAGEHQRPFSLSLDNPTFGVAGDVVCQREKCRARRPS
jgi:hypothetical protein